MKNNNGSAKIIVSVELMFVIAVFTYFLMITPKPIAPASGLIVYEEEFNFRFKDAKKLILSTNENFANEIIFKKDFTITLPPGTYYWKLKNWIKESEVRNFTINSKISLKLEEKEGRLIVYNTGNTETKIKVGNEEKETLDVGKGIIIEKENEKIIIEGEER